MLGREVALPVDLMMGSVKDLPDELPAEYVTKLRKSLMQAHTLAREKLSSYQKRQQRDYDMKLKVNTYELEDVVYVLDTARKIGLSPKLQQVWKGPMIVVEVISPVLFRVANRKKTFVLHHDRLKPCQDRDLPLWISRKRNAILQGLENEEYPEDLHGEDFQQLFEDGSTNDSCEDLHESTDNKDSEAVDSDLSQERTEQDDAVDEVIDNDNEMDDLDLQEQDLPPTRCGRRRRRPCHLDDYSL